MAAGSLKVKPKKEREVSLDVQRKIEKLTAKTSYEVPTVISYPLGGKRSYRPAYMGNQ